MGRPRKPPGQLSRARDARRHVEADAKLLEVPASEAPVRVRPLPGARERHARTRRWWRVAATSPQAALFVETDWLVMERLADLYDAFFGGELKVASEIRLCEGRLGFTARDRLDLKWKLVAQRRAEEDEAGGDVRDAGAGGPDEDPRLRLLKGSGG